MRFGLRLPTYCFDDGPASLQTLVEFAQRAEQLGFDSLWVVDHYLVARPSYRVAFLDPLVVLSAIAAATTSIRLGTSVLQLPLRQPVILAKEIATLDWISGGRFDFGIGNGWQAKEFEGVGVPLNERGARTDEYLEVMTLLWSGDEVSYHGRFVNFDDIQVLPAPVQRPYPPLSFGGGSTVKPVYADDPGYTKTQSNLDRVFRRIAKYASAWQATSTSDPALIAHDWDEIARHAVGFGRDPATIERMQTTYLILSDDPEEARTGYGRIVGKDFDEFLAKSSYLFGSAQHVVDELRRREEMGIDRMILTPVTTDSRVLDEWMDQIIEPLQRTEAAPA
jgi:alkanesulfonate monooxygenase